VNQRPRSWAASILTFALAVLAACWALNLGAELLCEALPVLVPVAGVALAGYVAWRLYNRPRGW